MPKQIYFYDTVNAIKNYDRVSSSSIIYHSFNITLPLPSPLINLKSITLKSVEIPINLIKPRISNRSFYIKYTYGGTEYRINVGIANRIYSSIASLITLINNKIAGSIAGGGVFINVSAVQIDFGLYCLFDHNCTTLEIQDTSLTRYILGFRLFTYTLGGISCIAESPINLDAVDTSIYIKILNLPVMNNNTENSYTFKVPLNNVINGTVYLYDKLEHQTIYFNKSNFILNKFDIIVVDRLGEILTGYYNWTFSLIVENVENNNNNTPQFLNINN